MSREHLIAARTHLRTLLQAEPEVRVAGIHIVETEGHPGLEVKVYGPVEQVPPEAIPATFDGFPVKTTVLDPPAADRPFAIQAHPRR